MLNADNYIPQLSALPAADTGSRLTPQEMQESLLKTGPAMKAIEASSAVSAGLWAIFDNINVDDTIFQAYVAAMPNQAADHSLHQHWQEILSQDNSAAAQGFINNLQGKLAEFQTQDLLEANGYSNVQIAASPNQPIWDISAIDQFGQEQLIQVKATTADQSSEIIDIMAENPDVGFVLTDEVAQRIAETAPEFTGQIVATLGPLSDLTDSVIDNLGLLSDNLGLDVPDGLGDILPYATFIIAGFRLVYSALQNERKFRDQDRTTINKMHVITALTVGSRLGINAALAAAGGAAGTAAGSVIPFAGNLIGGLVGTAAGAGIGMYLNTHLQPYMLDLALDITDMTRDDLWYLNNQEPVDRLAGTFQQRAAGLDALNAAGT